MTGPRLLAPVTIALVAGALFLTGCNPTIPPTSSAPSGSATIASPATDGVKVATTAATAPTSGAAAAGSGGASTAGRAGTMSSTDLQRLRGQLDAMQKELDALKIPDENGLKGAAGSLY